MDSDKASLPLIRASTQSSNNSSKLQINESVDCGSATHDIIHGRSATSADVGKCIRQSSCCQASEEAQQEEKQQEKKEKQHRRELMSKRRQMQSQFALLLGLQKANHESEPDATDYEHDMPPLEGIPQFLY